MKKYIFLLCITMFLIIFIGNLKPSDDVLYTETSVEIPVLTQEIVIISENENQIDDTLFVAKNLDGFVAIFVPNVDEPLFTTDIHTKTLPYDDQKMLDVGINLNSSYTLEEFIENYSS